MSDTASIENALGGFLDGLLREEVIGGACLADAVGAVDLSIAFSPVIYCRGETFPCEALPTMGGASFIVQHPAFGPVAVPVGALQVMRARYLLLRGHYYRELALCPSINRRRVIEQFFGGNLFIPKLLIEKNRRDAAE